MRHRHLGFFSDVVKEALDLFEYYRNGPVPLELLKPGFVYQACVDTVLSGRHVFAAEEGLGDHCIPSLGIAVQLKTSVNPSPNFNRHIDFCRSSLKARTSELQKLLRIQDVEDRVYDMFGKTDTNEFILLYVNLTNKTHIPFLLHDGQQFIGDWLKPENVCAPPKQTHVKVKLSKMAALS